MPFRGESTVFIPAGYTTPGALTMGGDLTLANSATAIKTGAYTWSASSAAAVSNTVPAYLLDTTNDWSAGGTNPVFRVQTNSKKLFDLLSEGMNITALRIYRPDTGAALGDIEFDPTFIAIRQGGSTIAIIDAASVRPNGDNAFTSGTSGNRWSTAFTYALDATNAVQPASDRAGTVGLPTKRWQRLFTRGTELTATEIVPGAGYGASATVTNIDGDDTHVRFRITASGAGLAANPTFTITYKNGTWTNSPFSISKLIAKSSAGIQIATFTTEVNSATNCVVTLQTGAGAPAANDTFDFIVFTFGG